MKKLLFFMGCCFVVGFLNNPVYAANNTNKIPTKTINKIKEAVHSDDSGKYKQAEVTVIKLVRGLALVEIKNNGQKPIKGYVEDDEDTTGGWNLLATDDNPPTLVYLKGYPETTLKALGIQMVPQNNPNTGHSSTNKVSTLNAEQRIAKFMQALRNMDADAALDATGIMANVRKSCYDGAKDAPAYRREIATEECIQARLRTSSSIDRQEEAIKGAVKHNILPASATYKIIDKKKNMYFKNGFTYYVQITYPIKEEAYSWVFGNSRLNVAKDVVINSMIYDKDTDVLYPGYRDATTEDLNVDLFDVDVLSSYETRAPKIY